MRLPNPAVSIALAVLLTAAACSTADVEPGTTAADSTSPTVALRSGLVRGLVMSSEPPVFVPCGSTDTLRLVEPAAAPAGLRTAGDGGAAFAVLDGESTPDRRFVLDRVVYASNERHECFADWSAFTYRATGQNPGWVAEVAGDSLVLRREGGASFSWTRVQEDITADRIQFTAAGAAGAVQLILQREPCRNPVSRAQSAWSARLVNGSVRLAGCAVPGVPAARG